MDAQNFNLKSEYPQTDFQHYFSLQSEEGITPAHCNSLQRPCSSNGSPTEFVEEKFRLSSPPKTVEYSNSNPGSPHYFQLDNSQTSSVLFTNGRSKRGSWSPNAGDKKRLLSVSPHKEAKKIKVESPIHGVRSLSDVTSISATSDAGIVRDLLPCKELFVSIPKLTPEKINNLFKEKNKSTEIDSYGCEMDSRSLFEVPSQPALTYPNVQQYSSAGVGSSDFQPKSKLLSTNEEDPSKPNILLSGTYSPVENEDKKLCALYRNNFLVLNNDQKSNSSLKSSHSSDIAAGSSPLTVNMIKVDSHETPAVVTTSGNANSPELLFSPVSPQDVNKTESDPKNWFDSSFLPKIECIQSLKTSEELESERFVLGLPGLETEDVKNDADGQNNWLGSDLVWIDCRKRKKIYSSNCERVLRKRNGDKQNVPEEGTTRILKPMKSTKFHANMKERNCAVIAGGSNEIIPETNMKVTCVPIPAKDVKYSTSLKKTSALKDNDKLSKKSTSALKYSPRKYSSTLHGTSQTEKIIKHSLNLNCSQKKNVNSCRNSKLCNKENSKKNKFPTLFMIKKYNSLSQVNEELLTTKNLNKDKFHSSKLSLTSALFGDGNAKPMVAVGNFGSSKRKKFTVENTGFLDKTKPVVVLHKLTNRELTMPVPKLLKKLDSFSASPTGTLKKIQSNEKQLTANSVKWSEVFVPPTTVSKDSNFDKLSNQSNRAVSNQSLKLPPIASNLPQCYVRLSRLNISENGNFSSLRSSQFFTLTNCDKEKVDKQSNDKDQLPKTEGIFIPDCSVDISSTPSLKRGLNSDELVEDQRASNPCCKNDSACFSDKLEISGAAQALDSSDSSLGLRFYVDKTSVEENKSKCVASDCHEEISESLPAASADACSLLHSNPSSSQDSNRVEEFSTILRPIEPQGLKLYKSKERFPKVKSTNVLSRKTPFESCNQKVNRSEKMSRHGEDTAESCMLLPYKNDEDLNDELPCPALMVQVQMEDEVNQDQTAPPDTNIEALGTMLNLNQPAVPQTRPQENATHSEHFSLIKPNFKAVVESKAIQDSKSDCRSKMLDSCSMEKKLYDQRSNQKNSNAPCDFQFEENSNKTNLTSETDFLESDSSDARDVMMKEIPAEFSIDSQRSQANSLPGSFLENYSKLGLNNNSCIHGSKNDAPSFETANFISEESFMSSENPETKFAEISNSASSLPKKCFFIEASANNDKTTSHFLNCGECVSESLSSSNTSGVLTSLSGNDDQAMENSSKLVDQNQSHTPKMLSVVNDQNYCSGGPSEIVSNVSNPETNGLTTALLDEGTDDLKLNLVRKNSESKGVPATSRVMSFTQPSQDPAIVQTLSKKRKLDNASCGNNGTGPVMPRSTIYSQLTGHPVVQLCQIKFDDNSLQKLANDGVDPASVVSAFKHLNDPQLLKFEVPDLSAELAYFHAHQIFSPLISRKIRKQNLFERMLMHLNCLLRRGKVKGYLMNFKIIRYIYLGKIYCAWVKPFGSSGKLGATSFTSTVKESNKVHVSEPRGSEGAEKFESTLKDTCGILSSVSSDAVLDENLPSIAQVLHETKSTENQGNFEAKKFDDAEKLGTEKKCTVKSETPMNVDVKTSCGEISNEETPVHIESLSDSFNEVLPAKVVTPKAATMSAEVVQSSKGEIWQGICTSSETVKPSCRNHSDIEMNPQTHSDEAPKVLKSKLDQVDTKIPSQKVDAVVSAMEAGHVGAAPLEFANSPVVAAESDEQLQLGNDKSQIPDVKLLPINKVPRSVADDNTNCNFNVDLLSIGGDQSSFDGEKPLHERIILEPEWACSSNEADAQFLSAPSGCLLVPLSDAQLHLEEDGSAADVILCSNIDSTSHHVKKKSNPKKSLIANERQLLNCSSAKKTGSNRAEKQISDSCSSKNLLAKACKAHFLEKKRFHVNVEKTPSLSDDNRGNDDCWSPSKTKRKNAGPICKSKKFSAAYTTPANETNRSKASKPYYMDSNQDGRAKFVWPEVRNSIKEKEYPSGNAHSIVSCHKDGIRTSFKKIEKAVPEKETFNLRKFRKNSTMNSGLNWSLQKMPADSSISASSTVDTFQITKDRSAESETTASILSILNSALQPLFNFYDKYAEENPPPTDFEIDEKMSQKFKDLCYIKIIISKCKWYYEYFVTQCRHLSNSLTTIEGFKNYNAQLAKKIQNLLFQSLQFLKIHQNVLVSFMTKYGVDHMRLNCSSPSERALAELESIVSCYEKACSGFERLLRPSITEVLETLPSLSTSLTSLRGGFHFRSTLDTDSSSSNARPSLSLQPQCFKSASLRSEKPFTSNLEDKSVPSKIIPMSISVSSLGPSSTPVYCSSGNVDINFTSSCGSINLLPAKKNSNASDVSEDKGKFLSTNFLIVNAPQSILLNQGYKSQPANALWLHTESSQKTVSQPQEQFPPYIFSTTPGIHPSTSISSFLVSIATSQAELLTSTSAVSATPYWAKPGFIISRNPVDNSACSLILAGNDIASSSNSSGAGLPINALESQPRNAVTNLTHQQTYVNLYPKPSGIELNNRSNTLDHTLPLQSCAPFVEKEVYKTQRIDDVNCTSSMLSGSVAQSGPNFVPRWTTSSQTLATHTQSVSRSHLKPLALPNTSCLSQKSVQGPQPQGSGVILAHGQQNLIDINMSNAQAYTTTFSSPALSERADAYQMLANKPNVLSVGGNQKSRKTYSHIRIKGMEANLHKSCESHAHPEAHFSDGRSSTSEPPSNVPPKIASSSTASKSSFFGLPPGTEKIRVVDLTNCDTTVENDCIKTSLPEENSLIRSRKPSHFVKDELREPSNSVELNEGQGPYIESVIIDCSEISCEQTGVEDDRSNDDENPFSLIWKGSIEDSKPVDKMYKRTQPSSTTAVPPLPKKKSAVGRVKPQKAVAKKSSAMRNNCMRQKIMKEGGGSVVTESMELIVPDSTSNITVPFDTLTFASPVMNTLSKEPLVSTVQNRVPVASSKNSHNFFKFNPQVLDDLSLSTKKLLLSEYDQKELYFQRLSCPPETSFPKRRTSFIYVNYTKPRPENDSVIH